MKFMSLKFRLLIALSVILIASFVATSFINYFIARDAVREELLNSSLPLTGKNIYSEIHAAMMRPILVSSSMANDAFLKEWITSGEHETEIVSKYLRELKEKYGFLTAFFVSNVTDTYYYQEGILKRIGPRDPHDVWFYAFTRSGGEYDLDVDTNQAEDNKLTIFINYRIVDDNNHLLGVTGVGVNMDKAVTLLGRAREKYHRNVYLVDQDGLVQVHPDKKLIEHEYITQTPGIQTVAQEILKPRKEAQNFQYDLNGSHYLLSAHYIPEFKWFLIVEQDEEFALSAARSNLIRTLFVGLGASILIIILCTGTINHFQKRLEKLAKTDPLTGAANRRELEERFTMANCKAARYNDPFSVIVLDIDDFKEINDLKGHLAGDKVLKEISQIIQRTIRPTDLLARWGGDEFLILIDGDAADAHALAERVQNTIHACPNDPMPSFSYGIAQYQNGDDIDILTNRADEAMYANKAAKRTQTTGEKRDDSV